MIFVLRSFLWTCLHAPMTNNDESVPFMNMNAMWVVVRRRGLSRGRRWAI